MGNQAVSKDRAYPSGLQIGLALLLVAIGSFTITMTGLTDQASWLLLTGGILALPYLTLCWTRPLLAWVTAVSLTLLPEVQSGAAGPGVGLADMAFAILVAASLARRITWHPEPKAGIRVHPFFLLAGAYALLAAASALYAADPTLALKDSLKWLEILAVVWVTKEILQDVTSVRLAILGYWGVFVAAAGVVALSRLIIWASGDVPYLRSGGEAGSLAAIVAIAILWTDPSKRLQRFARIVAVLGFFAVAVSLTRQSIVTLLMASLTMLLVSFKARASRTRVIFNLVFAGIAIVIVLVALPTDLRAFLDTRIASFDLSQETASNLARSSLITAAIDIWRSQPILGVGAGNFPIAVANYDLPGIVLSQRANIGPHNWFLNFAAETGVVGLLLFLAMVASISYSVWKLSVGSVELQQGRFIKVALVGIWTHWFVTVVVGDITGPARLSLAATIGLIIAARSLGLRGVYERRTLSRVET